MDDATSLRALVDAMPEPDKSVYRSYGSMHLESCFPNRKMIVYTLKGGQPSDIVFITFGAFMCDQELGPNAEVLLGSARVRIGPVPVKLPGRDLFMHLPQNFVLKYKGRQTSESRVDFVSHYAVLVKTQSKEIHQVESHTYCVTMNQFRERFPDLKIRY